MNLSMLAFPAISSILALLLYFSLGLGVGYARFKYKISPPKTTGDETFERIYRTHQNTLEQMVLFLPSLWLFSLFVSPIWGGAIGIVWVLGRIGYAWGYYIAAEKRAAGNAVASLSTLTLLLGAAVGVVLKLVNSSAG
jgi:glutathione S-transferase